MAEMTRKISVSSISDGASICGDKLWLYVGKLLEGLTDKGIAFAGITFNIFELDETWLMGMTEFSKCILFPNMNAVLKHVRFHTSPRTTGKSQRQIYAKGIRPMNSDDIKESGVAVTSETMPANFLTNEVMLHTSNGQPVEQDTLTEVLAQIELERELRQVLEFNDLAMKSLFLKELSAEDSRNDPHFESRPEEREPMKVHPANPKKMGSVHKEMDPFDDQSKGKLVKPVQIVEFVRNPDIPYNHIKLHEDRLLQIIPLAGERPVCIFAIAGPCRSGKSFFINLMLRYLQQQENIICKSTEDRMQWESPNRHNVGFPLASSAECETNGVHMWERPFIVKRNDGNEVAIFLVDTQATYDSETMEWQSSAILGISLLTSSCLILNVSTQLQEDVLQSLETFLQFAILTSSDSTVSESFKGPHYRDLMFLIRDWNLPEEYNFGLDGGRDYLENFLNTTKLTQPAIKTRQLLKQSFANVDCCLLPHPCERSRQLGFKGALSELDKTFWSKTKEVVEALLHRDKLPIKLSAGREMFAPEMIAYFRQYVDVFNYRDHPSPQKLLDTTAKIHNKCLVQQIFNSYVTELREKLSDSKTLSDASIRGIQSSMFQKYMTEFDGSKNFGVPLVIAEYSALLAKQMDNYFQWTSRRRQLAMTTGLVQRLLKTSVTVRPTVRPSIVKSFEENEESVASLFRSIMLKEDPWKGEIEKVGLKEMETRYITTNLSDFELDAVRVKTTEDTECKFQRERLRSQVVEDFPSDLRTKAVSNIPAFDNDTKPEHLELLQRYRNDAIQKFKEGVKHMKFGGPDVDKQLNELRSDVLQRFRTKAAHWEIDCVINFHQSLKAIKIFEEETLRSTMRKLDDRKGNWKRSPKVRAEHRESKGRHTGTSMAELDYNAPHLTRKLATPTPNQLVSGVSSAWKMTWRHTRQTLLDGSVAYKAIHVGSSQVHELSTADAIQAAMLEIRNMENIGNVGGVSGICPILVNTRVTLVVSASIVSWYNAETKSLIKEHDIRCIQCTCQASDDMRHVALVTRTLEPPLYEKHNTCHVFYLDSVEVATDAILTLGQAFEMAYQLALGTRTTSHENKGGTKSKSSNQLSAKVTSSSSCSCSPPGSVSGNHSPTSCVKFSKDKAHSF